MKDFFKGGKKRGKKREDKRRMLSEDLKGDEERKWKMAGRP